MPHFQLLFPQQQRFRKPRQIFLLLLIPQNEALYLSLDQLFYLINQRYQEILINFITDQHKVDLLIVEPSGDPTGEKDR